MRLFWLLSTHVLFLCRQLRNNYKAAKNMSVVMSCHVTTTGASVEEQTNAWKGVKRLCEQPQYRNIIMLRYTRTANKFDSWKDNLKNLAIELRRKGRVSPPASPPSSYTTSSPLMTASPMRSLLSQVTTAPTPSPADTGQDSPKSDSSELSPHEQTSSSPSSHRNDDDDGDEPKLLTKKTLSTPIVAPPAPPSPLKRSPPRGAASQSSPDLSLFRKEPPVLTCGDSYVVEYIGDHRIMHRFSKDIERTFAENNCSVSVTVGENIVKNDPNSPRARTLSMERLPSVVDRK